MPGAVSGKGEGINKQKKFDSHRNAWGSACETGDLTVAHGSLGVIQSGADLFAAQVGEGGFGLIASHPVIDLAIRAIAIFTGLKNGGISTPKGFSDREGSGVKFGID